MICMYHLVLACGLRLIFELVYIHCMHSNCVTTFHISALYQLLHYFMGVMKLDRGSKACKKKKHGEGEWRQRIEEKKK